MRWSYNREKSLSVAVWLYAVAALVVALVIVGGATRLTGSGLSITDWRPISGVIPPISHAGWQAEFLHYQQIPQYKQLNAGMTLDQFKPLFWWEWAHRLLARLTGLVFFAPFVVFLVTRRIPRRLIWRCAVIFALGALQGLVGWWMVASGLQDRVSVAPERLATHLGLALLLFCACVWTGLEAWAGRGRLGAEPEPRWAYGAPALATLVYVQCLFGALVSGGRAGLIDQDWPLMAGKVFPEGYVDPTQGVFGSLLHSLPAVQFNHRLMGYLVFGCILAFAIASVREKRVPLKVVRSSWALVGAATVQVMLGVLTLWAGDPPWLAALHQLGAVGVLTMAIVLAWRTRRSHD